MYITSIDKLTSVATLALVSTYRLEQWNACVGSTHICWRMVRLCAACRALCCTYLGPPSTHASGCGCVERSNHSASSNTQLVHSFVHLQRRNHKLYTAEIISKAAAGSEHNNCSGVDGLWQAYLAATCAHLWVQVPDNIACKCCKAWHLAGILLR
jgi:hypothetical protein